MPWPSLSSPPLPKAFRLSWLSHLPAWLAVPRSPFDSPFFAPQHTVILTLTLTLTPGLSPLFTAYGIWGPGPRQGPVHASAPRVHFWLSGAGVQGIGFITQLSLPLTPPFQAIQLSHAQDSMREP